MSDWANEVLHHRAKWAVTRGDCLEVMAQLPADSIDLVFGSPPYVDARLYLEGGEDLGIARGPSEWVDWMVRVYIQCLGACKGLTAMVVEGRTKNYSYDAAPAILMTRLLHFDITLRKPPIYRRVGIPGSGGPDWLRNDWEWIVCATRGGKLPWSDNTACGHPPKWAPGGEMSHRLTDGQRANRRKDPWMKRGRGNNIGGRKPSGEINKGTLHGKIISRRRQGSGEREEQQYKSTVLANPGNVIDCKVGGGAMGSNLAHENEAPFPESLAEFFVLSFCPPGGIVLDPFCGSGTTLAAAVKHGRRALGIDLRTSQVALTERRLSGVTPALFG